MPVRLMYYAGTSLPMQHPFGAAMPIFFWYILENSSQAIKKLIASADNKQNMTLSNARRSHTKNA